MRIALSLLFWIAIAPAVFFLLFDLLVLPAKWTVDSIWAAQPPTGVWVGLQVYAVVAMFAAGRADWVLWKRFRSVLVADPDLRGETWIDSLPPSLRLPLALCLVLVGAAIIVLGVGGQSPLANSRSNIILFGGLVQAIGLLGIVLTLRNRFEGRRPTSGCS